MIHVLDFIRLAKEYPPLQGRDAFRLSFQKFCGASSFLKDTVVRWSLIVHHDVKVRLYPTTRQADLLAKMFGCKRFVWNAMLQERKSYFEHHGKGIGRNYTTEKQLKVRYPFLKDSDSIALQQARIDLDTAYKNLFEKLACFPRFKSRKGKQSYRTVQTNDNIKIDFEHRKLKLPKIGWVTFRDGSRRFDKKMRNVTVSRMDVPRMRDAS